METKSESTATGTNPGAAVVKPVVPQPVEEYQTGRGCLMLTMILLVLVAIVVVVMLLKYDPAALPAG